MLDFTPHDYQEEMIRFMISRGGAGLFADPGLGKTLCALAAFKILKDKGLVDRALIICKLRPCYLTWPKEIVKWGFDRHLSWRILHGPKKLESLLESPDLSIINPEGLSWLIDQDLQQFDTQMLIVDESSAFKSTGTMRFKLLKAMLPLFSRRYIMTGSPAPNSLLDLFGQCFILDFGEALHRYITKYRATYFDASGYDWKIKDGAAEQIYERLRPLVIRVDAEDHLKLPERIDIRHSVMLPKKVMQQYHDFEKSMLLELETSTVAAVNAGVLTQKLRQVASGGIYTQDDLGRRVGVQELHEAKNEAALEVVEELQGSPALIAYEFEHDLNRLQRVFPLAPHIGGGVSMKRSGEIMEQWNAGEIPVLLVQTASVAHGLNMQEGPCHTLIFYSLSWNWEDTDQLIRRLWRQGQKNSRIMVHWLIAEDTIDQVIFKTLGWKERSQKKLLDALKDSILRRVEMGVGGGKEEDTTQSELSSL